MISRVVIPDLGATKGDVELTEWLVKPGDFVKAGSPLFVVTTDKASVEVEAFRDGYIRELLIPANATVELGTVVAIMANSLEEPLGDVAPARPSQVAASTRGEEAESRRTTAVSPMQIGVTVHVTALSQPFGEDVPDHDGQMTTPPAMPSLERLLDMFRRMVLIRRFEEYLYHLFLQGLVPGTLHQYQGQEAVAVGVCAGLRTDDVILSTHRPVGHLIAKGASVHAIAAELWGKATGCAGGKGGQMHLVDLSVGALPSNAIVGANIPIATGAALGFRLRGLDRVAVSFFGDGASNIGAFHEGINLAAVKNAPVVFVCENNLYAASTHISLAMRVSNIAERARAYGIPGVTVDGMDVLAVYRSARAAVLRARRGEGPTLLECHTYRYAGHSRGDPGGYRTKEELQRWRERDPIIRQRNRLIAQYEQDERALEHIERECQAVVEAAVEFARSSPEPFPEACFEHVYAGGERNG